MLGLKVDLRQHTSVYPGVSPVSTEDSNEGSLPADATVWVAACGIG